MSDVSPIPQIDPNRDPVGYIRTHIWPPLPTAYGLWLGDLLHRARAGADPNLQLPVPDAVMDHVRDTGTEPPGAYYLDDDPDSPTLVITLAAALALFGQEGALFPDDDEHAQEPVTVFDPLVALTLANTATPETVAALHDPFCVDQYAEEITAGRWQYQKAAHVIVGKDGRLLSGLNTLLAIVKANAPAPALAAFDTDHAESYTWRPPTFGTEPPRCPKSGDTVSRTHEATRFLYAPDEGKPDPGPYTEGERVTCPGCGAEVPVTPVAENLLSAGRLYVARLTEHAVN